MRGKLVLVAFLLIAVTAAASATRQSGKPQQQRQLHTEFNRLPSAPNGNCLPRGQCIATYPRYPDQHTLCLQDESAWHCAALAGVWGDSDWSFGPANERDVTMMGGMGVDLNETFTAHALPQNSSYGECSPAGVAQWEVTRELSYLQGTVTGNCTSAFFASGRTLIGAFNHSCAVLTQITIGADAAGDPMCVGCRCCDTSVGCPILPP